MAVRVRYLTDPVCPWSWSIEPVVRKLMVQFGDGLSWTFVMAGLARSFSQPEAADRFGSLIRAWLDASDSSEMPVDPRLWFEGPLESSYPACMAVKAAQEQASDGGYRYLRALREGVMCFRRKLDHTEALVEEARRAGLDVSRFRIDLRSHASLEAFAADLEKAKQLSEGPAAAGAEGGESTPPSMIFVGDDGREYRVTGARPYEAYLEAAEAAGARPSNTESLTALECLRRFDRAAAAEVALVCELSTAQAHAELWSLASQLNARPLRVLTGSLWELA